MVVNNLNVIRIPVAPPEANTPLIVDANTVLTGATPLQLFKSIAGRDSQVIQLLGGVYESEFPEHRPMEVGRQAPDGLAPEQSLRVPIGEAVDHLR